MCIGFGARNADRLGALWTIAGSPEKRCSNDCEEIGVFFFFKETLFPLGGLGFEPEGMKMASFLAVIQARI